MSVPPSRAQQEMADAHRHAAEAEAERVIAEQDAILEEAAAKKAAEEAAAEAERKAAEEAAAAEAEAQAAHEPVPADDDDARAAASHGAQVVLDPDSPAAIAARGGAGPTMRDNVEARDEALREMGHDPASPSAERTDKPEPAAKA